MLLLGAGLMFILMVFVPPSSDEDILDSAAAIDALKDLADDLRDAVVLRVIDQLDYQEIAAQLGCSAGAARVRVFRGLRQLSEVLK